MKKFKIISALALILVMSIICTFFIVGCSDKLTNSTLQGFYESEMKNGYHIQFSFENSEENTFIAYINNIEINKGTYEDLGNRRYTLNGDIEDLEIELEKDDSFNLYMEKLSEKLNEGKPINLKNTSKTPLYFETVFSDEDKEVVEKLLK